MGLYGISKVTTIIEIVLTCNCLLFFEFYGLAERKSIWVIIGLIYRGILILVYLGMGIFILAFVAPLVDGIGSAVQDGIEDAQAEHEINLFNDKDNGVDEVNDVFSTIGLIYNIFGGYCIGFAVINLLKIVLVGFVYNDIKKEETEKKKQIENQIGDNWAVPTHHY